MSYTAINCQTQAKPLRHNLSVGIARTEREIHAAQKLRYQVFAGELGARLSARTPGVDQDIYDAFCEHLVVRDENSGAVVGTYRILSPEKAREVRAAPKIADREDRCDQPQEGREGDKQQRD